MFFLQFFIAIGVNRYKLSLDCKLNRYCTFNQIEFSLLTLKSERAKVQLDVIGKTYENRNIYTVMIGDDHLPKVVIDCGMHAREWATPAFCIYLIHRLTQDHHGKAYLA